MKKTILISGLLILLTSPLARPQKIVYDSVLTGVCFAGNKVKKIYIPPPAYLIAKGAKQVAGINIDYSNTPAYMFPAVDLAVGIISGLLPSDVVINLTVSTEKLEDGVLANAGTTALAGGWAIDALEPDAWYPVALAEKIYGSSLNTDQSADIFLTISTEINWYYGTDGKTPTFQYDLVTVVLHELIHGLGFFDSMYADASTGSWGYSSLPIIYDIFIENFEGHRLTDTAFFDNPSAALKAEMTSDSIFFNGPVSRSANSGNRIRIYAPGSYSAGSSISHLDESLSDEDGLMTPYIDRAEAIHDPGKLALAMLGDLGWINTRFVHEVPSDTEEALTEVTLNTTVVSDTTYDRDNVGIVWSFDGFETIDSTLMSSPLSNDTYAVTITIPFFDTTLEYYFYGTDHFGRTYRSPSYINEFRYSFRIGMDTVKPVLYHTPVEYYLEKIDTMKFEARAADNIGIDTVFIEYRVNNGITRYLGLNAGVNYLYSAEIDARQLSLQGGDTVFYRIVAKDKASNPNITTLPENDYYPIIIEDITSVLLSYTTDFTNATGDFFNIGFRISHPENFNGYGLHSDHPYKSPDKDGAELEFTAMLRHPIKYDANGLIITYYEVALIEPGEKNSIYGDNDFYDYVILEASNNYGKTWFPLVDGYDCRVYKTWETTYNSLVVNGNSFSTGNESLLQKRYIFPKIQDNISDGDTILVRFRLYSDPYAHGWGWVIEDFHIGPLVDNIENTTEGSAFVYPNPGNGIIKFTDPGLEGVRFRYDVFNSSGVRIRSGLTTMEGVITIDISDQSSGIYFIVLDHSAVRKTFKYVLIK